METHQLPRTRHQNRNRPARGRTHRPVTTHPISKGAIILAQLKARKGVYETRLDAIIAEATKRVKVEINDNAMKLRGQYENLTHQVEDIDARLKMCELKATRIEQFRKNLTEEEKRIERLKTRVTELRCMVSATPKLSLFQSAEDGKGSCILIVMVPMEFPKAKE